MENGASVCNTHHRYAETNHIPPQAFWRWIDGPTTYTEPRTPDDMSVHVDKWGDPFEEAPWKEHRQYAKYPSSRHLPFSHPQDQDDTSHGTLDPFLDVPLVVTVKMDGGNAMLVKDQENPVRARNGRHARHESFDLFKSEYWDKNLYEKIPPYIQIFGEWIYAKHSIHYGCDCADPCDDIGPALDDYFQVFGVRDTRYDLWVSWPEVEAWAHEIGYPTTPVISCAPAHDQGTFTKTNIAWDRLMSLSHSLVDMGHEGLVVRPKFPLHWGQYTDALGKFVREGHVTEDVEHWSHREVVPNRTTDQ